METLRQNDHREKDVTKVTPGRVPTETPDLDLTKQKVVVLGAGSSGLGAALGIALNTDQRDVHVLEKKCVPGGLAGSFSWKGHIIDYGPHRLSPNLLPIRILAEELLGPDCLINKSQHGVQLFGRLYQFPPRVIDWIYPDSIFHFMAIAGSFILAKFSWLVSRFRRESFESTIVAKFGKRFYHQIIEPMAEKVWIQPKYIDPAFVNQRFALIQPIEMIKKVLLPKQELNPSNFYYPRKGFQQLWDNFADYLDRDGQRLEYGVNPHKIEVQRNRIVGIHYTDASGVENKIEASDMDVVSTIPILKFLELLHGFDANPLIQLARSVKFRSMFLVAFEFDQPRTLPFRTLIFPEKEFWFNRLFEQNEYSRETVKEGKSVIVADITYNRGDDVGKLTDAEVIARVRSDLMKLKYIDCSKITDVTVERVEFAYAVPDIESRRAFHQIHHELKKIRNLYLMGRFSVGEYDNSDYAIDSGLSLGATLSGRASRLDYLYALHPKRGRFIVG